MESCGRSVGEDRPLPAGEHGGQPPALEGHVGAANGIDALMDAMQAASRDPGPDAGSAQAELTQLREGNHPMLPGGQGNDEAIQLALSTAMVGFRCREQRFPSIVGHGAMVAPETSRVARGVLLSRDRTGLGGRYHQTVESTPSSSEIGFV